MSFAIPILTVTCNYCSEGVHPKEVFTFGESVLICFKCYEKHAKAVEAFNPPSHCVGCMRTWEQLKGDSPGTHVSMYACWRDGEYTLLCAKCDAEYIQKRRDLYGNTRHGWEQKVK